MQEAKAQSRSLGMDVTRAVACAMVVLLHTAATFFYSFGPSWIASDVFNSASRASVPMFFMLSGALLLWKEEPIFPFYRRRVLRIMPPLVIWTAIYVYLFRDTSPPLLEQVSHYLMAPYGHLWYFYVALGLGLAAPYLGKILRNSTELEMRVFLVLWFFFACVLNQLRLLYAIKWDPITLWGAQAFAGYIGFFVLGAYLTKQSAIIPRSRRLVAAIVFAMSSAAIAYATYRHSVEVGKPNEIFFVYQTPLIAIAGASAFRFFASINELPAPVASVVRAVSDSSLGIYCLHPMIISYYVERLNLAGDIHSAWLKIPVLWTATFGTAAVAIFLARKIPLVRRIA